MKIQTFVNKISLDALKQMDDHINDWLAKNGVVPQQVHQVFGYERHHHHTEDEPVLVTCIWY